MNFLKITLLLTISFLYLNLTSTVLALDKVWVGHNCEDALAILDNAGVEAAKDQDASIIVIARLGSGETGKALNARRLAPVMRYLKGKATNPLVSGSGARVKGYGRIEVYVAGKLVNILAYKRNRLIDCGNFQ
jgi:hypothetical protein